MPIRLRGLKAWFLISGCVGVLVALVLGGIASYRALNPKLLLTLWPPSIIGLADPSKLSDKILFGVIELGGNFLLYGIVGTGLGFGVRLGNRVR
jgi:hypothetical protein